MTPAEALALLLTLRALSPERRRQVLAVMPEAAVRALAEEWWWRTHGGQLAPRAAQGGGPWRVWALVAGRGFGKTRAGAEWVWARAREGGEGIRIALAAATREEAARVMVEGESGLLASARTHERPLWTPSRGELRFPSGARAFVYSAERPDALRGPQHHFAWVDELAKWKRAESTWDNLLLGLRLGERPRTVLTTTPRPVPLLKRILARPDTALTRGRTDENPHLPADFIAAVTELYGGTRLGRQELEGLLLDDVPGALWTREMLEKARAPSPSRGEGGARPAEPGGRVREWTEPSTHAVPSPRSPSASRPSPLQGEGFLIRTVIGVDPPATAQGDSCGIVVCAMAADGTAWVLADLTVAGERPEGWARRVAAAAEGWDAQCVVAEKNQGGDMVESVLRAAGSALPIRLATAVKGKAARAEPIALHFEAGRARLAGTFPELEDQLCGLTYAGYEGPGNSPDRADAMVWAMTELFKPAKAAPRVRVL